MPRRIAPPDAPAPAAYYDRDGILALEGDMREVLAGMEGESFTACVTDPPYGLEFMGKEWDHGVPSVPFWRAVLRVLKPGGILMAFGGTRTFHRMACAVEDAGFEVRDCLMWMYGCLSEDTEILVDGRWEPYDRALTGRRALCYDMDDDTFSWEQIQGTIDYAYEDTAFRVQSDYTDQIVSRNHRCVVEQGGRKVFQLAEDAARQRQARIPVLEDVQGLLKAFPHVERNTSTQKRCVLKELHERNTTKGQKTPSDVRAGWDDRDQMRGMRQSSLARSMPRKAGGEANMLLSVQRRSARSRVCEACVQRPRGLDGEISPILSQEDVRPEQPSMEGRRDVLSEARQLFTGQVRTEPPAVQADGEERRLCWGAPPRRCARVRTVSASQRDCPSCQPRSDRQPHSKSRTLLQQQGAQAIRASRYTQTDLARVTPIFYKGLMWCVRVPTGAFVARRNGQVFITGNSGFPKSYNVSKGIDQAKGAKREKIGKHAAPTKSIYGTDTPPDVDITAPATPEAALWQGYGSALKPAWEPIILAMKPLDGAYARNALRHGVAGLNVDGGRIGLAKDEDAQSLHDRSGGKRGFKKDKYVGGDVGGDVPPGWDCSKGRWPANVLLQHDPRCVQVGVTPSPGYKINRFKDGAKPFGGGAGHEYESERVPGGEVEVWACVPGCPVRMLDGQSSQSTSGAPKRARGRGGIFHPSENGVPCGPQYGDAGGASRFFYTAKASTSERSAGLSPAERNLHPTVKPVDLMRYLLTLVTMPSGTRILDPFMGSGSTLVAAKQLGVECVGVELERASCVTTAARLSRRTSKGVGKRRKIKCRGRSRRKVK